MWEKVRQFLETRDFSKSKKMGLNKREWGVATLHFEISLFLSSKLYGIQTFESSLAAGEKKTLYPLQLKNSEPWNINSFSENCEKSISMQGRWESGVILIKAANGEGGGIIFEKK